ncbi:MAG: exodeoxyribonuclease VII small subunit [Spirochaetaceae bacterium]|nr:exodeoxyribonuclease VII small subunit [Spirochaetaceae bacterium]
MATFEERLLRLEQIGETLRHGNQPIDQAMELFEEGVQLARTLERELAKIDRRIEIVVSEPDHADSAPVLAPFADDSPSPGGAS